MAKGNTNGTYSGGNSTKRPGVHSKRKASKLKQSKNYLKRYKGQGK